MATYTPLQDDVETNVDARSAVKASPQSNEKMHVLEYNSVERNSLPEEEEGVLPTYDVKFRSYTPTEDSAHADLVNADQTAARSKKPNKMFPHKRVYVYCIPQWLPKAAVLLNGRALRVATRTSESIGDVPERIANSSGGLVLPRRVPARQTMALGF
ncbi:hypothetical protein HPB50_022578 [Hyalomma asiaticum]|uniref:Uncharacterized protein n=1 Tax=Hyalomma asiaticum TaxID=266040 RepID=A0ACB7RV82_HYAAI|nr:hypothetical protein HPB50_022578 [Hyalomma asiaticum]